MGLGKEEGVVGGFNWKLKTNGKVRQKQIS